MQAVAFKADDTIIAEGDPGDAAYFIVSGSVEVHIGKGDKAKIIGTLGPGEVFGEMSLIEPGPRSATITALEDVECLATSYEEFISAIEDHPERAVAFMKTLVKRLRQMNALLESANPRRRGLRGVLSEYRESASSDESGPRVADLSWTMLW